MRIFKTILTTSAILAVTTLVSCEDEAEQAGRIPSLLDTFSSNYTFTELDAVQLSTEVGTAKKVDIVLPHGTLPMTIEGGVAGLNSTLAEVGLASATDTTFVFRIEEADGNFLTHHSKFTKSAPLSFRVPSIVQKDNKDTLWVDLSTKNAIVDTKEVLMQIVKVGQVMNEADYAPVTAEWSEEGNFGIALDGSTFDVADTIYVKATAAAGNLNSEGEVKTAIGYYAMTDALSGVSFNKENAAFSLWLNDTTSIESDVEFVEAGFTTDLEGKEVTFEREVEEVTYTGTRTIEFVVDEAVDYDLADIVATKALFEGGTPVEMLSALEVGSTAIFKISETAKAEGKDDMTSEKWGILKVVAEDRPADANGDAKGNTIVVDYRYVVE